jgi:hypothetical protein
MLTSAALLILLFRQSFAEGSGRALSGDFFLAFTARSSHRITRLPDLGRVLLHPVENSAKWDTAQKGVSILYGLC